MRWVRIGVECAEGATDAVAAALLAEGCGGTEHSDAGVAGYLPVDDTLEGRLLSLHERLDALPAEMQPTPPETILTFVQEEDWAEAWKAHFHPIPIGERLVVAPSWSDYIPLPQQVVVELDPGMAFGTGAHPTTRLCLEALERGLHGGETVVDWGTGSGLLAVAAAKLGAARVLAGDVDPLAVSIARENCARNGVEGRVTVVEGESPGILNAQADVTVCNILAGVIIELAEALADVTRPGGRLIASGIIDTRAEEVKSRLSETGFDVVETRIEGEWVAMIAVRRHE